MSRAARHMRNERNESRKRERMQARKQARVFKASGGCRWGWGCQTPVRGSEVSTRGGTGGAWPSCRWLHALEVPWPATCGTCSLCGHRASPPAMGARPGHGGAWRLAQAHSGGTWHAAGYY